MTSVDAARSLGIFLAPCQLCKSCWRWCLLASRQILSLCFFLPLTGSAAQPQGLYAALEVLRSGFHGQVWKTIRKEYLAERFLELYLRLPRNFTLETLLNAIVVA